MKIINRERGSGKTTMLIHTAYVTGYPIVVSTESHKKYVQEMAKKDGCNINVFTLSKFFELKKCGVYYDNILIDECQDIIETALNCYFLNANIVAGTMSVPMVEGRKLQTDESN